MFFLCKNGKKKPIFQIFYCFSVNNHGLLYRTSAFALVCVRAYSQFLQIADG